MDKNGVISITDPQKGVAQSSILGNEAIIGCEIFDEPGVLKIQTATEADSSQINNPSYMTITGVPLADVTAVKSTGLSFRTVVTETGQVVSGPNANYLLTTQSFGWDACVWSGDFTVVSYASGGSGYIGVIYHDDYGGETWFGAKIGSLDAYHYIKLCMGKDGYMYFTNGNNIGRITAISITLGVLSITYTSTNSSGFVLPKNSYGVSLTTLGDKLLIGTQQGNSYSVRSAYPYSSIVIWDYVSANADNIIEVNENGINAMIPNKNQVYFSAGNDGNIYITDGVNYQKIKRLPYNRAGIWVAPATVYPNAMCINQRGNLLVGLSATYDANSPNTTGVWEIGLMKDYPTHLPFFSRDGNLGNVSNVRFGSVRVLDDNTLAFGVQSGSTYELSKTSATALNTNYTARWRTQAYVVSDARDKKTFEQLEFLLTKPLVENQGVKISYRTNLIDDFTTIDTWNYSSIGAVMSHFASASITNAEIVQFEIALNYDSSVFGKNVNLLRTLIY